MTTCNFYSFAHLTSIRVSIKVLSPLEAEKKHYEKINAAMWSQPKALQGISGAPSISSKQPFQKTSSEKKREKKRREPLMPKAKSTTASRRKKVEGISGLFLDLDEPSFRKDMFPKQLKSSDAKNQNLSSKASKSALEKTLNVMNSSSSKQ